MEFRLCYQNFCVITCNVKCHLGTKEVPLCYWEILCYQGNKLPLYNQLSHVVCILFDKSKS